MKKLLLELKNITAGYDNKIIFKNVNFSVYKNDFIGIIGPNGGGKTTLLKIILGLLKPISGEVNIYFNKNKIGYLPQISSIDKDFPITVIDVVLSGLIAKKGLLKSFNKEHYNISEKILEKIGILNLKNNSIKQLSGGQLQRVFLARALVSNPEILILDEPNNFVDKIFEKNFYEILKQLSKDITILLVSHDLGMIPSIVKTILCVNRNLHYHNTNKISNEIIKEYSCPIDIITHGKVPHRVLVEH